MDEHGNEVPRWNLQSVTENYTKYVRNPSNKEKQSGLYFPRVTAYDRKYQREQQIKIEFSAPKLLFLNNLEELTDAHFSDVIDALQDRMKRMGIRVFRRFLENAAVSTVHFGRNFLLRDGQTATNIISQLQRIDVRKSFDFARSKYTNDGQSLCCHTTAHELIFYDKIADLNKGKKRSIDKDQTAYQMGLFDDVRNRGDPFEVLRMEVRLSQKQKMNAMLRRIGVEPNPTFQQVFSSAISKKILTLYWKEIVQTKNLGTLMLNFQPIDLVKRIGIAFPNTKPKQLIAHAGLLMLAQSGNGLHELRSVLAKSGNDRTWSRIMKEHQRICRTLSEGSIRSWVKDIEHQLSNYSPFKINN